MLFEKSSSEGKPKSISQQSNHRKSLRQLIDPNRIIDESPKNQMRIINKEFVFQKSDEQRLSESSSYLETEIDIQRQVHPLQSAGIFDIFPFLKLFNFSYSKNNQNDDQQLEIKDLIEFSSHKEKKNRENETKREAILRQFDKKYKKIIKQISNHDRDPLRELGPGIISFHQFQVLLLALFFMLTLLHIPVYQIFSKYQNQLHIDENENIETQELQLWGPSLGDLGFSKTECKIQKLVNIDNNKVNLNCKTGKISMLVDFGMSTKIEDQMQCAKSPTNMCNDILIEDGLQGFNSIFLQKCIGRSNCTIDDLHTFVQTKEVDINKVQACLDPQSTIFVQYKCEQSNDDFQKKMQDTQTVVVIELFCQLLVFFFVFFALYQIHLMADVYKKNNIKAKDYTMFIELSKKQIQFFDQQIFDKQIEKSRGEQLIEWLKQYIKGLNLAQINELSIKNQKPPNILRMDLVFDNQQMINLLNQRGQAINNQDNQKIILIEEKIKKLIPNQYFTNIVGVFITYEKWEDIKLSTLTQNKNLQIFGQKIQIKPAKDPQSYIWENMGFSFKRIICGLILSISFMFLMIVIAYYIQFKLQKSISSQDIYESFDCNIFHQSIIENQNSQTDFSQKIFLLPNYSKARYQREAFRTWRNYYDPQSSLNKVKSYVNGTLSCFCEDQYKENGIFIFAKNYRSDGLDQSPTQLQSYLDQLQNKGKQDTQESAPICQNFIIYQKVSYYYFWIISVFIIIYNYVFYSLTAPALSYVGFKLRQQQLQLVSFTVFCCLFIDTLILPVLIGANFIEFNDKNFLDKLFTGQNTDFGWDWYQNIGQQIETTMIVMIFNPFIDFMCEWVELQIVRSYKWKYYYQKIQPKDKRDDFLKYLDLNAGPEYNFHSKIAYTSTIVFITLIFGPMLPIMYPFAFFAVLVQYLTDKLFLTYFYRLPPQYSEKLTLQHIKLIAFAPLLSMAVSYWSFGNRQMFENKIDSIQTFREITFSHHVFTKSEGLPNYTHLYWIKISLILSLICFFAVALFKYFKKNYLLKTKTIKILPDYLKAISKQECKDLLQDEQEFRDKGGFEILQEMSIKQIKRRLGIVHEFDETTLDEDGEKDKNLLRESIQIKFKDDLELRDGQQHNDLDQSFTNELQYQYHMTGQQNYHIHKSLNYLLKFNNQNIEDELYTKLLLMLPMVRFNKIADVQLHHLKIYQ